MSGRSAHLRGLAAGILAMMAAVGLAGCSEDGPSLPKLGDLNPFAEKQQPLPGKRIPVMQVSEKVPGDLAPADSPISLPSPQTNEEWTQPGGVPTNAPGHLALSASPRQSWSADAGKGSSKSGRLTASPIVYGGRVYTLDANAKVSAFSISGGQAVWRASIAPDIQKATSYSLSMSDITSFGSGGGNTGFGGGLAADNGRIYAASGYGLVVALDPASGKRLWERNVSAPVRASPTASGDKVFVVTAEGRFFCLSGADGSELWVVRGLPQQASLVLNASPAVAGDVVVAPYPSGDLVALKIADGSAVWSESLSRSRTTSQLNSLSDAARPSIDGGTVYAIGHGGRMIATALKSGERLWSLNVPGTQTPWVAGESVFVVDTQGQLMAVTRRDGKIAWTAKLPGGSIWSGPTLAGGMLWLVSGKGTLVGVEPTTGKIATQANLGSPAYIAPVVAQGKMFVMTDDAKLIAFN